MRRNYPVFFLSYIQFIILSQSYLQNLSLFNLIFETFVRILLQFQEQQMNIHYENTLILFQITDILEHFFHFEEKKTYCFRRHKLFFKVKNYIYRKHLRDVSIYYFKCQTMNTREKNLNIPTNFSEKHRRILLFIIYLVTSFLN